MKLLIISHILVSSADIFSSFAHIQRVGKLEKSLTKSLQNYIDSEEEVFYILCKIMRDLNWRYHYIKPYRMPEIVSELHELLSFHIPDLYNQLMKDREDEAGLSCFIENLYNFTMQSLCVGP